MNDLLTKDLLIQARSEKDFTIDVGSVSIKANKFVLKASSKYFREYFTSDTDAKDKTTITLPTDKNADIIEKIIDFVHGEQIEIKENEIIELVKEAICLFFDSFEMYCRDWFSKNINKDNALKFYDEIKSHLIQEKYYNDMCLTNISKYAYQDLYYLDNISDFDNFKYIITYLRSNNIANFTEEDFMARIHNWNVGNKNINSQCGQFLVDFIDLSKIGILRIRKYEKEYLKYYSGEKLLSLVLGKLNIKSIGDTYESNSQNKTIENIQILTSEQIGARGLSYTIQLDKSYCLLKL